MFCGTRGYINDFICFKNIRIFLPEFSTTEQVNYPYVNPYLIYVGTELYWLKLVVC